MPKAFYLQFTAATMYKIIKNNNNIKKYYYYIMYLV